MAKGKNKKHYRRSSAIPVAPMIPIAYKVYDSWKAQGSMAAKINDFSTETLGYMPSTGQFVPERAIPFWLGMGAALVTHKIANSPKVGVNRMIRKATGGFLEW